MKIVFMGTSSFGLECLQKLIAMKQDISAIYTLPSVINISWSKNPIHLATHKNFTHIAHTNSIPIIEVKEKIKYYAQSIKSFSPNFILAAGWYYIIPKDILRIPDLGCGGIHASLLPRYRGGAPLSWAIINGERQTGVSLFYFAGGVDTGDIIGQKKISITERDTIQTVYKKAAKTALRLIEKYIPLIEQKKAPRIKQNDKLATFFPSRIPEDGIINWNKTSVEIYNWIRAQTKPYPGAFFYTPEKKKIIVWASKVPVKKKIRSAPPGAIIYKDSKRIDVATSDYYISITHYDTI